MDAGAVSQLVKDYWKLDPVAGAKVVFVNGLGFEGWMQRLVRSSGSKASVFTVTKGIKPREMSDGHGHGHDADPHAWQSVANAKIYVGNIRDALIAADAFTKKAVLGAIQQDDASVSGVKPAGAPEAKAAADTPEGWKAEYQASKALQAEFRSEASYVAYRKADAAGQVRQLTRAASAA